MEDGVGIVQRGRPVRTGTQDQPFQKFVEGGTASRIIVRLQSFRLRSVIQVSEYRERRLLYFLEQFKTFQCLKTRSLSIPQGEKSDELSVNLIFMQIYSKVDLVDGRFDSGSPVKHQRG